MRICIFTLDMSLNVISLPSLEDVDLPVLKFASNWLNLLSKVLFYQNVDARCYQSLLDSEIGTVPGVAEIISDFMDYEYHVKWVIWNSLCRYYLYEYLELTRDVKCYSPGLFREMHEIVVDETENPLFTENVVFCNNLDGFEGLRMIRVAHNDPDCVAYYMITYGKAPGSLSRQLHIRVLQQEIQIQSRFYEDTPIFYFPQKIHLGLCHWEGRNPNIKLSRALLRRDMIGIHMNDPKPAWCGQTTLYQYGFKRIRSKKRRVNENEQWTPKKKRKLE